MAWFGFSSGSRALYTISSLQGSMARLPGLLSFQTQQLSVVLHTAAAWEIGHELGLAVCHGTDPRDHVARPARLGDFVAA